MQGPSAIALRQGGQGGALKYKLGVQVIVTIAGGSTAPPGWRKKTTLQEVFGEYGRVLEIFAQDDSVAIIEYEDKRDAQDAVESMNGKKICGSVVNVKIRQDNAFGRGIGGCIDDRVFEMAQKYSLDATSAARLVSAFRDRSRRGCNIDMDLKCLAEHLAASNKPSALVCMKLADLREGKPIGPCKFSKAHGEQDEEERHRPLRNRSRSRSRDRRSRDEQSRDGASRDRRSRDRRSRDRQSRSARSIQDHDRRGDARQRRQSPDRSRR